MEGIVVGCDCNQEWLLDWWWGHYSKHNNYPVAFFDFGMTEAGRSWCRKKGSLHTLPPASPLKTVSSSNKQKWEQRMGESLWPFRAAWFKKPLACQSSPFETSCWIDLDCEVRAPLDPLFHTLAFGGDLALVREQPHVQEKLRKAKIILPNEATYNSGVAVFRKDAPILNFWAELAHESNNDFMGDQDALSRLIHLIRYPVVELPPSYNWTLDLGPNPDAHILHYVCGNKLQIMKQLGLA